MRSKGYAPLELVDRLAAKTRGGDRRAADALAGHLEGVVDASVESTAGRLAESRGHEKEDLKQAAWARIFDLLETWKPEKSSFRSYVFGRLKFEMLNIANTGTRLSACRGAVSRAHSSLTPGTVLKKGMAQERAEKVMDIFNPAKFRALEEQADGGHGLSTATFAEAVGDGEPDLPGSLAEEADLLRGLEAAIARLPERWRGILVAWSEPGRTVQSVADEFGLTNQRTGQIIKNSIRKIRMAEGLNPDEKIVLKAM